ncbi:MAG: MinD/ParA family ATP-binding protein [Nocardioidaceae bacterium]
MSDIELSPDPAADLIGQWRVPADLENLGPVKGSGLLQPSYLLRRGDGQVVQVSELLHLVVSEIQPGRTPAETASRVSAAYGRALTTEGLRHLVTTRLQPLGLVEPVAAPAGPPPPTAAPLLSLSLKGTLVPPAVVRRLAALLSPLFWPPVVCVALTAWLALDVLLVLRGDLNAAVGQLLSAPASLLALYVMLTLGALFHETGHATACAYDGARPGAIGFGVYLVFPAFYTDVTDSYRLGRAGRLRTDLGGLYFNVLWLVAFAGVYLLTGDGLVLLAAVVMHVSMLQQLVPAVRFDGYYVLSDAIGVPDLFARVRPVLLSLLPGRPVDRRVTEISPGARRVVIGWVLVVVPTLLLGLGWLLWSLPAMTARTWAAAVVQGDQLAGAWGDGRFAVVALSVVSLVMLVLPLLGVVVLFWRLGDALAGPALRALTNRPAPREETTMAMSRPVQGLTAAAFNDREMLPQPRPVATSGWQHALYKASGHVVRPGPGAAERRRQERAERLREPIDGTRRVVVMSRKGGVGKTTVALALGSILATQRGDRVVAVDANPDAGNLAHRVAPPSSLTITDVLRDLDKISSYAELKKYTSQAEESRLEVLASDDDPRIGMALDRSDYHRLIGLLDQYYNVILLDTGTGILDSANQGLLADADELVIVLRAGIDGGRAAALTLDWLEQHEYADLVRRAIVVINALRPGVGAPLEPIEEHFAQRCGQVICVPWDPALETGGQTVLSRLSRPTRESLMDLAAAVAGNFPTRGGSR